MDQGQQQQRLVQIRDLPKRPQRSNLLSKVSRQIDLVSNHFQITFKNQSETVAVYSVKIEPEIASDARRLKDQIISAARQNIEKEGLRPFEVRGLNLWSQVRIDKPIIVESLVPETNQQYALKIELTSQFSLQNLNGNSTLKNPVLQTLNVRIKNVLREKGLLEMGKTSKYYDPASINKNKIDQGLKVWRGYKTALHVYNAQPYLLIDFSSRVLRSETAFDFMREARSRFNDNASVKETVVGLSVIASYGNYRIYRIDDIRFDLSPRSTFDTPDGKITYIEYYRKRYNIQIRNEQQPLLVTIDKRNPDKITNLIPELMNMTGLTDAQRKDWQLMKEIATYTKLTPEQRNQDILYLHKTIQPGLEKRNLILSSDQNVKGYQLDPPDIKLGKKNLKNDVGFFILRDPVLKPGHIKDWFLIYQSRNKNDDSDADYLVEQLQKNSSQLGIKLEQPYFIGVKDTNPRGWCEEVESEIKKGGQPQMIVSFVPERDKDRLYGPLKELCLNKIGVQHQNVLLKFLKNKNPGSVASKIIQQMNVKIGCPIWSVPRPQKVSEKTMLIGIDIYHKLVKGNQSCMGIVASMDQDFTSYFSRIILMKKGSEMSTEIAGVIEQAIKAYFQFNGKKYLPDTIIIYRDGVGEGQIQTLLQTELTQIEASFKRISLNYQPMFALIMINKKINHRFFSVSGGDGGGRAQGSRGAKGGPRNQLVNPPTGTIIADKITSDYFDFFLCAQYVTEGTCTPTHYSVLANTTDWSEETFWTLTYYQCFNYLNWSGAVRVPACVQYAHKLAYLSGDTFQKQLNQKLENTLCYL